MFDPKYLVHFFLSFFIYSWSYGQTSMSTFSELMFNKTSQYPLFQNNKLCFYTKSTIVWNKNKKIYDKGCFVTEKHNFKGKMS